MPHEKVNGKTVSFPPVVLKCPYCGEDEPRLLEVHRTYVFCSVCSKRWQWVEKDISGVIIDGE